MARGRFSLDDCPGRRRVQPLPALAGAGPRALADRLDAAGEAPGGGAADRAADLALATQLGGKAAELSGDPIDRLYGARDALTAALEVAGAMGDGVRRALRLAIADDLRLADDLGGGRR
jgi:hypothetical protein